MRNWDKQKKIFISESVFGGFFFSLGALVFAVFIWYRKTFGISFAELLFTLVSPLTGSDEGVVFECLKSCIPALLAILLFVFMLAGFSLIRRTLSVTLVMDLLHRRREIDLLGTIGHIIPVLSIAFLFFSVWYAERSLQIRSYLESQRHTTAIYEDFYVDPNSVEIAAGRPAKNLICLYLESMETTYASEAAGGRQPQSYIPELTAIAKEHCSFSHSQQLGGFHSVAGTTWTMGSLFATTSGLPYAFPVGGNSMGRYQNFASGVTALGDILEEKGYQNEFLCGSDGDFAGRKTYFQQHGNYIVFDYFTAIQQGYIAEDYRVWWGYEDKRLYQIAKDELLNLAQGEKPFNFTMLTVDTHHVGGYVCDLCGDDYPSITPNVVSCADRQAAEFIRWCQQQDFYEDTVIVVMGDHPRMDKNLVDGVEYYDRTIYNCILNSGLQGRTKNREFTALDMFPTILSAMGFQIEGNRLGLGVNLFSEEKTLCETMGFDVLDSEFSKSSNYYVKQFA